MAPLRAFALANWMVCLTYASAATLVHAADTAYRCLDAGGHVLFSDMPCPPSSSKQSVISTIPATKGIGGQEYRQLRNILAIRNAEVRQRAPSKSTSPNNCPTERDISNLETRASSITLDAKSRSFLLAEVRRARACSSEGGNYTQEDWERINAGIAGQSRIRADDREIARRSAESTHWEAASSSERQRMQADADREASIEAARERAEAARRNQAGPPDGDPSPQFISNCSGGSCFDNQGGRYQGLGGGQLLGPNGAICQQMGNMVKCP